MKFWVVWLAALAGIQMSISLHTPALPAAHDLPFPKQVSNRVLVAVTHGPKINTPTRIVEVLKRLMVGYVSACEHGFEIHVVLVVYRTYNESSLMLPTYLYTCVRLSSLIPIALDRHSHEPLPNGTFGTAGTLASKHRVLFNMKRALYDYFVLQEDDALIGLPQLLYFSYWATRGGPQMIPGFITYSVPSVLSYLHQQHMSHVDISLSYRFKHFTIEKTHLNDTIMTFPEYGSIGYMLSQEMLFKVLGRHDWLNIPPRSSEYNPYFNSDWLREYFTVFVPTDDWAKSLIHHMGDKYLNQKLLLSTPVSVSAHFVSTSAREFGDVVSSCTSDALERCLASKGRLRVHILKHPARLASDFLEAPYNVSSTCARHL